jgi:hypothetical protein
MIRSCLATALIGVVISGCSAADVATPTPTTTPTPTASETIAPTPTPIPTLNSATPLPSTTPMPTSQTTGDRTAFDRCVHEYGIYAVTFPSDWYTNVGMDGWDDCGLFAPQTFASWDDPAIAIRLGAEPDLGWNNPLGPLTAEFEGYTVIRDEETTIGGRRARVREFILTTDVPGSHSAGDMQLSYGVELAAEGWFINVQAVVGPEEFEETTAVVEAMLESLEVLDTSLGE